MSVNTNAGHRMMGCSKAVNVSATMASQLVRLHAWDSVVPGLRLGACWDPLSTGNGGGGGEHLKGNFMSRSNPRAASFPTVSPRCPCQG